MARTPTFVIHGLGHEPDPDVPVGRGRAAVAIVLAVLLGFTAGRVGIVVRGISDAGSKNTRERTAIRTLREIGLAEAAMRRSSGLPEGAFRCGDLAEIVSARLVAPDLGSGVRGGYTFHVGVSPIHPDFCWVAIAEPEDPSRADRSFVTNQSEVIFPSEIGPISVESTYCTLPLGPPFNWPDYAGCGKSSGPDVVPTLPVEGGLQGPP